MNCYKSLFISILFIYSSGIGLSQSRIFWTEGSFLQELNRIDSDATNQQTVMKDTLNRPENVISHNSTVYFSDGLIIKSINQDGSNLMELIIRNHSIGDITIDPVSERLYWADNTNSGSILYSSNLDGSDIQQLYEYAEDFDFINSIYIDQSSGLLYFSSEERIFRLESDMQSATELINGYTDIKTVIVDPQEDAIIWFDDWEGMFFKSSLDGTNLDTIFDREFWDRPDEIFVDIEDNIVYWFDKSDFNIYSLDYEGNAGSTLMNIGTDNNINGFYSIYYDFDNEKMFWGHSDGILKSRSRDDSSSSTVLTDDYIPIQEMWGHNESGKIYIRHEGIWSVEGNGLNNAQVVDNGDSYLFPHAVDDYIYYYEPFNDIKRVRTNGSGTETITNEFPWGAIGMHVDVEAERIYYSNQFCNCVRRFFIGSNLVQRLYDGTDIGDLVYDKENNAMFWQDEENDNHKILSGNSFGTNLQTIYTSENRILSIALNREKDKIFWVEQINDGGAIYSSNYDGTNLQEITLTATTPRSIAVLSLIDADEDGYYSFSDCDETDASINPGATEIVYNGIDEDCNPLTFDDDLDQDGFVLADDCNDENSSINPNVDEIPYNGIDDDCNPMTFDDDLDQDGFLNEDDCDDENSNINPDAEEIPNNDIDEDCDGMDLISSIHEIGNITVNIYPNPTVDIINFEFSRTLNFESILYDVNGKILHTSENQSVIDINDTTPGTYLLKIRDLKTGEKVIERIVIGNK